LDDRRDFADADRGLIAGFAGPVLGDDGHEIGTPTTDNPPPRRTDG
jgi:hypothetical protein